MQSPQLPPSVESEPPYYARPRPEQVDICYRAACNGDHDTLKEQAGMLQHSLKFRVFYFPRFSDPLYQDPKRR